MAPFSSHRIQRSVSGSGAAPSRRFRFRREWLGPALFLFVVGLVYAFSNPQPAGQFDYQLRIAEAFLGGRLGTADHPSWLNEMVPSPSGNGEWYSVFPLGSILCMLPLALVKRSLRPDQWDGAWVRWIVALIAMGIGYFALRLSARFVTSQGRRLTMAALLLFGTWLWTNLTYGGAWDLALGFAVLGQFGTLCFALEDRPRPVLAGLCFAIAFGNRTEVLLVAPLLIYLLCRPRAGIVLPARDRIRMTLLFLVIPLTLGLLTLAYNDVRFGSVGDFGYARIPGVLRETWYRDGLTSPLAVPMNLHAMLFADAWRVQDRYPFFVPNPMGGAILGSCPFLVLVFARKRRDQALATISWVAIGLLTVALWIHGNSGGWQFTYRYGLVLLPWLFLLLLDEKPRRMRPAELALLAISVMLNAFATYLFYWTHEVHV